MESSRVDRLWRAQPHPASADAAAAEPANPDSLPIAELVDLGARQLR
jgi:hypothetical protein